MRELIEAAKGLTIPEPTGTEITLWHGGRNLESDYLEVRSHGKGRWEHGPGLYLTTHYETARKYARGGGKLYLVTVRRGTPIDDVTITREEAVEFVERNITRRLRKDFISDIDRNLARMKSDRLPIEVMVNLCLNLEALPNSKTDRLRQFLIDHGADYTLTRYGGRDETVMVVFNPKVIERVQIVSASEVSAEDTVLPAEFG